MLSPDQIPHGLALIARKTFHDAAGSTTDDDWNAAIAAAINAWPGMFKGKSLFDGEPMIFLPLPAKENTNAEG